MPECPLMEDVGGNPVSLIFAELGDRFDALALTTAQIQQLKDGLACGAVSPELLNYMLYHLHNCLTNLQTGISGHAFIAESSFQANLAPGVYTKIEYDIELLDLSGEYDPVLARWTPQDTSLVLIEADLVVDPDAPGSPDTLFQIALFKNGVFLRHGTHKQWNSDTQPEGAHGTWIDSCNGTTDYYEIFYIHNKVNNENTLGPVPRWAGAKLRN